MLYKIKSQSCDEKKVIGRENILTNAWQNRRRGINPNYSNAMEDKEKRK